MIDFALSDRTDVDEEKKRVALVLCKELLDKSENETKNQILVGPGAQSSSREVFIPRMISVPNKVSLI